MSRFLFNPAVEMTAELFKWFQMTQPLNGSVSEPRVLVRQTSRGLLFTKISTGKSLEVVYKNSTYVTLTPGFNGVENLSDEQHIEIEPGYIDRVGETIVKYFEA
ncbi:hypothetical protein ST201phi2-1p043 [Pseudomonas phage 201phi2-1]|uniref:Uncharacterized protein n=1 Tax=Pseudomonas phage 201phi2-1 TaxID=198110 RepID=B3FK18_BP201|nr:hypothetical protein ST201phi2-1p043 [Pseudomonas phage 201phi2-1]ABY62876.1 hypothetical protein 201phi2-1p043 [Pseudomonas phage 201phi2-1]